ncbi:transposase [Spirillospora sp. NPDC046719]
MAPPTQCRRCGTGPEGAEPAEAGRAQVIGMLLGVPHRAPAGRAGRGGGRPGKAAPGAPHLLVVRSPERFAGVLITDGYPAYQGLLSRLPGIQQCCAHVIRRCRAVTRLGPGSLQSWAGDVIAVLHEARQAVEEARARGDTALGGELLEGLRERYDKAAAFGVTNNRLLNWAKDSHLATPSPAGCRNSGNRCGCSPATSPWSGRTTPPSAP